MKLDASIVTSQHQLITCIQCSFRKVPGDVCYNDLNLTKPRIERCDDVLTPQTPHAFDMLLVNSSDSAAIGDKLFFVVKVTQHSPSLSLLTLRVYDVI